ncbi:Fic family protein [Parafilimonas sp.]|uniref:Fic family protein n=1 Tax=Parafilimonas sp. TaxID=1969739 RepID=UPI0039E4A471
MQDLSNFKAGVFAKTSGYKYFIPEKINMQYKWSDIELTQLCDKATLKLGELNAFASLVSDIDHFIQMHVAKEATVSSKIEGTQTNIEETLQREEFISPEKRNDWREVNNYIKALNEAINGLKKLPLSSRLLKKAHKTLLKNVRGEHKMPGEFRRSQNWIGGASLKDAVFVPPTADLVGQAIGDVENLMHNDECGLPHVMRIALAHYQFETIHPFLDGNGRIGRLMISLYFVSHEVLSKPVLYLSDFFEKNKTLYYDNLMRVRTHNNLVQWLKFVLVGIIETAQKAIDGLKKIIAIKKKIEEQKIVKLGKKITVAKTLSDYLFLQPIVLIDNVVKVTGLSKVSAYKLIEDFEKLGILVETTGMLRYRMFQFKEYFDIFKN